MYRDILSKYIEEKEYESGIWPKSWSVETVKGHVDKIKVTSSKLVESLRPMSDLDREIIKTALIISALPIEQVSHILKDRHNLAGYPLRMVLWNIQEDGYCTGQVTFIINVLKIAVKE